MLPQEFKYRFELLPEPSSVLPPLQRGKQAWAVVLSNVDSQTWQLTAQEPPKSPYLHPVREAADDLVYRALAEFSHASSGSEVAAVKRVL